jgi:hypothetical protein
MKNYDIDDNGLKTRKGMTRSNTSPFYPGCLQFGYDDALRVHYLKSEDGDFGPQTPATTQDSHWECYVYAKEATATTAHRTLYELTDSSGDKLIELYWFDDRLRASVRPQSGKAYTNVSTGAGSEYIPRTGTTNNMYGVDINCQSGGTVVVTLRDFSGGLDVSGTGSYGDDTWDTCQNFYIGCDENIEYPSGDWTNASNNAFYGTMGEFSIARGRPTDPSMHDEVKLGNMEAIDSDLRICYFPLRKDFSDKWGLEDDLASNPYEAGAGLSSYSVLDSNLSGSRDILYCTKSIKVDTFNNDRHIYGKTSSFTDTYRNYMTGSSAGYSWTFDVLPVKFGASTTAYDLLTSTTAGPVIKLDYLDAGRTRVKFKHDMANGTAPEITHDINNNFVSKITCEYSNPGTTASLNIYQDTMLVSTTTLTTATAVTSSGNLVFGMANTTAVSAEFFLSSLVFHNTDAGSQWGDRPQESYGDITTYTTVYGEETGLGDSMIERFIKDEVGVSIAVGAVEKSGDEAVAPSLFDLPLYSNAKMIYLLTETTGFDTADNDTPHGVLRNMKATSTTDGSDLILQNNTAPIWKADRNDEGLVTTSCQGGILERDGDNIFGYIPVSTNLGSRVLVSRNSQLVDDTGNNYNLNDSFNYSLKRSGKSRGFMYGNSLFIHNENNYLRFNGNEVRPCEAVTPTFQMSLVADNSPSTGLNGTYKYAYTYTDKSGIESYPSLPVSTTVSTGNIAVSLNTKISTTSYLYKNIQYITIYRNKGGTTSTTDLDRDADRSLYNRKRIPLSAVIDNAGSTLFTDTAADSALGGDAPQEGDANPVPPCKYSTIFKDTALFTGNPLAPNTYYQSQFQQPQLLGKPAFGEFLTEDGEHNTAIGTIGTGFIVFKKTSRKYVRGFIGSEVYEYPNGGCMSHDSLVSISGWLYGLGSNGFFKTDGYNYVDLNDLAKSGRVVSSVRTDVETWADAVKEAAHAEYHEPTQRYICYVNSKCYVLDLRYGVWVKYEDVVGLPFSYKNDMYFYTHGWTFKEGSQSYTGTTHLEHSIASGDVGTFVVTSTTGLPTTNTYGLPVTVGTSFYWTENIAKSGNNYTVTCDTSDDFTNKTEMTLGRNFAYADSKFFQARTPNRNKIYKRLLAEHDNQTGEMKVRLARNNADFDRSQEHYIADTSVEKINTVLRVRSENMAVEFAVEDGKAHKLRNYQIEYQQESEL